LGHLKKKETEKAGLRQPNVQVHPNQIGHLRMRQSALFAASCCCMLHFRQLGFFGTKKRWRKSVFPAEMFRKN